MMKKYLNSLILFLICITLSGCTVNLEQQVTDNNSKGTKMIWISDEVIDNISAQIV